MRYGGRHAAHGGHFFGAQAGLQLAQVFQKNQKLRGRCGVLAVFGQKGVLAALQAIVGAVVAGPDAHVQPHRGQVSLHQLQARILGLAGA